MAEENRDGLPAHPRSTGQSRPRAGTQHHCQDSETAGHRARPQRRRKTTWKEFLTRHWEQIVACDFFTVRNAIGEFVAHYHSNVTIKVLETG